MTRIDGVATRSVLQCTSPTSYDVYPPAGSGLAATSFDLDSISGDTQAAVTVYTIDGTLTDPDGAPLSGQQVILGDLNGQADTLFDLARSKSTRSRTDKNGFYGITTAPGDYTLTLSGKSHLQGPVCRCPTTSNPWICGMADPLPLTLPGSTTALSCGDRVRLQLRPPSSMSPASRRRSILTVSGPVTGRVCGHALTNGRGVAQVALLPVQSGTTHITAPPGTDTARSPSRSGPSSTP